jgi:TonB family protein
VTIGGAIVSQGSLLDRPGGRIGFRVLRGDVELRAMRVAPLVDTLSTFHPELPVAGTAGVTVPSLAKHVPPIYPSSARSNGISGRVLLQMVVLPDGRVGDVREAFSPHADLTRAAIACVRKWRFNPALKDGAPVAVAVTAEVAFNLAR